jgi:hypothetical protein
MPVVGRGRKRKGPPPGGWRRNLFADGVERALRNAFGPYIRAASSFDDPTTLGGFDVKALAGQIVGLYVKKNRAALEQIYQAIHVTAKSLGGTLDGGNKASWKDVAREIFRACASPTELDTIDFFPATERHARSFEPRDIGDLTAVERAFYERLTGCQHFGDRLAVKRAHDVLQAAGGSADLATKAVNEELSAWRQRHERNGSNFDGVVFLEMYDTTARFWDGACDLARAARAAA